MMEEKHNPFQTPPPVFHGLIFLLVATLFGFLLMQIVDIRGELGAIKASLVAGGYIEQSR